MRLRNTVLLATTLLGCSHPMTKAVQSHDLVAACHARSSEQYENNIPPETLSAYKAQLLAQTDIRWRLEAIKSPEVKGISDRDTQRAATFYRLNVGVKQLPAGFTAHLTPSISMDGKEYEISRLPPPKSKGEWAREHFEPLKPTPEFLPPELAPREYVDEKVPGHPVYRDRGDAERIAWLIMSGGTILLTDEYKKEYQGEEPPTAKEKAEFRKRRQAEAKEYEARINARKAEILALIERNKALLARWEADEAQWKLAFAAQNEPPKGNCESLLNSTSLDLRAGESCSFLFEIRRSIQKTDSRTFFGLSSGFNIGQESCDYASDQRSFTGDLDAALLSTFGAGEVKAKLE